MGRLHDAVTIELACLRHSNKALWSPWRRRVQKKTRDDDSLSLDSLFVLRHDLALSGRDQDDATDRRATAMLGDDDKYARRRRPSRFRGLVIALLLTLFVSFICYYFLVDWTATDNDQHSGAWSSSRWP